jgi:hypothetical protein
MLLVGADPELFVAKNGQFISGHVFECGTKDKPLKTKNGSIQVDGLALEFNVTPSSTKEEFVTNVWGVYNDLTDLVREKDADCSLEAVPAVPFSSEYLSSLPENVSQLGCNPDFNAYLKDMNEIPDCRMEMRTGSGHVHIGWGEEFNVKSRSHFNRCCAIVKQLDFYLGLPSLKWDDDPRRRDLYGQAGAFRPKSYGLEYRVLSNRWLSDGELMGLVFDQTKKAMDRFDQGLILDDLFPGFARKCINQNTSTWDVLMPEVKELVYG